MKRIAFIGVGNRAGKYLSCLPADASASFLVDPDPVRLTQAARRYGLPPDACFPDAASFFARPREVDGVVITTPDRQHFAQAMAAVKAGYPVLLEKPAAVSQEEFDLLLAASERTGVPVSVCLVMRFHPFFRRIKELVDGGTVGRLVSIDHTESIGPDRMAHTFVRGLWSRKDVSCPIFLSKCSHDADFLLWIAGGKALEVSTEGRLTKFRAESAPAGSAPRCMDCPLACPYSAVSLYRDRHEWVAGFDVPEGKTLEEVIGEELETGRYGRCVYRCDNDVNDFQTVRVRLDSGIRLRMELEGVTLEEGRRMTLRGTEGSILVAGTSIFVNGREEDYSALRDLPLHAGADRLLVEDFIDSLRTGKPALAPLSSTREAHRICFLAG